ncbi:unnamed protein product [Spirodela intermedia]|uniref:Methyltransferase n=1 Tax=Spirodela intermedia TaxID=51605 RepID=A0A7I8IFI1_SPIIN|nr:unnamed protein product [Spirodela intermedia]CAA6656459.1 unnamed protein product [Spirodela intermedia]
MAKEHSGSPKLLHLELKKRRLTSVLGVSALCVVFYILGAWHNASLDFAAHHMVVINETAAASAAGEFPACDMSLSEYTPCQDPKRSRKFERRMLIYRERHCPEEEERLRCLIPAPPRYKKPFRWPESRDYAWYDNIPHRELSIEKAVQNWIQVDGDRFRFPGGGTMFPRGADAYIDDIAALIPLASGSIRTALDTGCGVASWGAYLLKRNIMAMSFAPRDTHEAQVQFALERGVPAMIGIMASQRLPYPTRAFDMAHCSRCLIPWFEYGGQGAAAGGYWILSGPPIRWRKYHKGWERTPEDLRHEQDKIEALARRLCWTKVVEKDDLAMEKCITPLPEEGRGELERWPERSKAVPPRVRGAVAGVTAEGFLEDGRRWAERVAYYQRLAPALAEGRYRNVMDMNAGLGGFAAALAALPVWVMNVVPAGGAEVADTLGADWCEAFSTYPRTYDLLHAHRLFSLYLHRCEMSEILLEMDRMLRPEGAVVVRDEVAVLVKVQGMAEKMRWRTQIFDHETGPFNPEKILVAVKTYWTGGAARDPLKQ